MTIALADRFTRGDCWVLAIQISRLSEEWQCAESTTRTHAFCVRQKGREWEALDIGGLSTPREVVGDHHKGSRLSFLWPTKSWREVSEETLFEYAPDHGTKFEGSWEVAQVLAPKLISEAERRA